MDHAGALLSRHVRQPDQVAELDERGVPLCERSAEETFSVGS